MEVILLERIDKLGQMGDVVNVKPGYARNYLLPKQKAMRATDENREIFETQRTQLEAENLDRKSEAESVGDKLSGLTVVLVRQAGDAGQLYGSVNARDVAEAVSEAGFSVARAQIRQERPIKLLGLHPITIDLHPEVAVEVIANVARSEDEAETQASTGRAVLSAAEEERLADEAAAEAAVQAAEAVAEQAEAIFEEEVAEDAVADAQQDAEAIAEADADAEAQAEAQAKAYADAEARQEAEATAEGDDAEIDSDDAGDAAGDDEEKS